MPRITGRSALALPEDTAGRRLLARVAVQSLEHLRTVNTRATDVLKPLLTDVIGGCDADAKEIRLPEWPVDEDNHPWSIGAVLEALESSAGRQLTYYNDEPGASALRGLAGRLKDVTRYEPKKRARQFGQPARTAVAR